ncbi:RIP metalloprotease RseP [Dissulfurirhabdus thermomarina]|uniref:Zinc metalloprotease n=2 Tax=Dissulfurirhabdus thermomarina TaxID=1765737 RepID=A0A6N9TNC4_DISTH|nr:RIP metalloprotease RseP [Dissulfurirhabdus thermomarina]NDY42791.1 RIP metalloprotease RseP [Dissulfurirhabdus thermomarina]NMX23563.1 RIP metalloprotease RseP [Dissulfurirhabdus thermomarina]
MTTFWSFLLVLSGLIFVHEFGHFLVARAFGIRVLKFSLGFGPRLWGVVRGGTDYCISAVPLGGFVKMLGEVAGEPVPEADRPRSFSHQPVWKRALVVAAGPVSNLLFACLVYLGVFLSVGQPLVLPHVGDVQKDSPAEAAGIRPGDTIVAVDGHPVATWSEVVERIRSGNGAPVRVRLHREDGTEFTARVTPRLHEGRNIFGERITYPVIGVVASGKLRIRRLSPARAAGAALAKTWEGIVLVGKGFWKIVQRVVPLSSLGGPILIAQLSGQVAEQGLLSLLYFMAFLSINLGLLNLLPIPLLDGGHLLFHLVEALRGRPLSERQVAVAQQVGLVLLGALVLLVTYNDILRLLGLSPGLPR